MVSTDEVKEEQNPLGTGGTDPPRRSEFRYLSRLRRTVGFLGLRGPLLRPEVHLRRVTWSRREELRLC